MLELGSQLLWSKRNVSRNRWSNTQSVGLGENLIDLTLKPRNRLQVAEDVTAAQDGRRVAMPKDFHHLHFRSDDDYLRGTAVEILLNFGIHLGRRITRRENFDGQVRGALPELDGARCQRPLFLDESSIGAANGVRVAAQDKSGIRPDEKKSGHININGP